MTTKRWMFALALALGAWTGCDQGTAAPGAAAQAQPSAEDVVARHLAALGGVERLKATQSLVLRGDYTEKGHTEAWVAFRARPNKVRKEGVHEGKPFVKIFDGTKGWIKEGEAAFTAMAADKTAKMKAWAEFDDPLVDYAARGHKVALVGLEEVAGAKAYHLTLTLASGDVEERFLDADSLLDVQRVVRYTDKEGAKKTKVIRFTDWREVQGLKFNFASEGEVDGERSTVKVASIEVDGRIDPAKFSPELTNTVAMAR